MIEEDKLDGNKLYKEVKVLLSNNKEYKTLKDNLNRQELFSSSDKIYKEIKELVLNDK